MRCPRPALVGMTGSWYAAPLRRGLVLALVLLALGGLAGCSFPGSAVPTATPEPTATGVPVTVAATATVAQVAVAMPSVAPSLPTATATIAATATVSATATVLPTMTVVPTTRPATPGTPATPVASATPVQGGPSPTVSPLGDVQVIRDAAQACELSIPAGFVPTSIPGTYASADGRVTIALQSLPVAPGEGLDDLALPFMGEFIPTVEGYQQTAIIRLADNLRIDFSGNRPGRGVGTVYFHQFGATVCAMTLFVGEGSSVAYDAFAEALIAALRPKGVG
ncbi:MAG: hypothetical protein U0232_11680 [Thermomicrobiales bacterium]